MKLKWGTTEGAKPPEALLYIMIILVMKGGGHPSKSTDVTGCKKKNTNTFHSFAMAISSLEMESICRKCK